LPASPGPQALAARKMLDSSEGVGRLPRRRVFRARPLVRFSSIMSELAADALATAFSLHQAVQIAQAEPFYRQLLFYNSYEL
jgi:hypothetical protein